MLLVFHSLYYHIKQWGYCVSNRILNKLQLMLLFIEIQEENGALLFELSWVGSTEHHIH